jgi:hypothetical protein
MCDGLGYERFGAHGGDRGALVTASLAHANADRLIGAHIVLDLLPGLDFDAITPEAYGPEKRAGMNAGQATSMSRALTASPTRSQPRRSRGRSTTRRSD